MCWLMLRVNVFLGHCCGLLPWSCWSWCLGYVKYQLDWCLFEHHHQHLPAQSMYLGVPFPLLERGRGDGRCNGLRSWELAPSSVSHQTWVTGMALPRAVSWYSLQPPSAAGQCLHRASAALLPQGDWCHLKPCLAATPW